MIVVSLQSLGCMSPPGLKQFDPVSTFISLTQIQKEEFVLLPRGHNFEGQKKLQLLTGGCPRKLYGQQRNECERQEGNSVQHRPVYFGHS